MTTPEGGSACARCTQAATHKQGHQWLCPKHYRLGQMIANAGKHGKAVPTRDQLEAMIPEEMKCPNCTKVMVWLAKENQTLVATLQHYRDGAMAIVCRSCNTRHAFAPSDSYRDQSPESKWCPQCKTVKPLAEYAADNSRSGPMKIKSWCKSCSSISHANWRQRSADAMLQARKADR